MLILYTFALFLTSQLACTQQSILNFTTDVTDVFSQQLNQQLNFSTITGFFPIDWYFSSQSNTTSLFFELVTKQGQYIQAVDPSTPIIFWFEGGPGCSSQFSSWTGFGPYYTDANNQLQLRLNSWNKLAHLVFVDQPLNVGFSYTNLDILTSYSVTASEYLMNFLYNFYQQWPFFQQNPTYFFGSSYAGHYIPYFAFNFVTDSHFKGVNFKGVSIGDSYTNPIQQIDYYDTYAYSNSLSSLSQRLQIQQLQLLAMKQYYEGELIQFTNTFNIITNSSQGSQLFGYANIYNVQDYNPDFNISWFKNQSNLKAYGIPEYIKFVFYNWTIFDAFSIDNAFSYQQFVEYLLERNYTVQIYNGQLDMIVNTPCAYNWIYQLNWSGLQSWQKSIKKIWQLQNVTVGTFKQYDNFAFVMVYGAGHTVPHDQQAAAFDMVNRTLNWDWKI